MTDAALSTLPANTPTPNKGGLTGPSSILAAMSIGLVSGANIP